MRYAPLALRALLVGLAGVEAQAGEPRWIEVRSPNFVVISDAKESEARRVAWQFEQIRAIFSQQWRWARLNSGRPFIILAARDENSLKELLPEYWESKDRARPAGLFVAVADRSYAALRVDMKDEIEEGEYYRNPYHVVYHEYVHLLVNLNFEKMPAWFNEGLAEYWGDTIVKGGHVSKGMPIQGHLWLLREHALLPMGTLLTLEPEFLHNTRRDNASIFYAQSWALVHYLLRGAEGDAKGALDRLATALKKGVPPKEAMARSLPAPVGLGKALAAYIRKSAFQYTRTPAPLLPEAMKAYAARTLSGAASRASRGAFLAQTGRTVEARPLIEEAVRLDPNLADAHEAAGLLALREGRAADARASFAKAVELDPEDPLSQFMKGQFLLTDGPAGGDTLAEAEAALLRSTQLNSDFAPAYAMLATVSMRRGASLGECEPLARRAIALEPGNPAFHLALATILAAAGKAEPAQEAVRRALAAARSDAERAQIGRGVESLGFRLNSPRPSAPAIRDPAPTPDRGLTAGASSNARGCEGGEARPCTDPAPAQARIVEADDEACGDGFAASCERLGATYEFGRGVAADAARAAVFYEKACADDQALGCQRLGFLRETGRGIPKDGAGALTAYTRACQVAGEPEACVLLARLLVDGSVPRDTPRAVTLATGACAQRAGLCGLLGSFHHTGVLGAPNEPRALELFLKACEGGDNQACTAAGLVRVARGTAAEQTEAAKLFAKACQGGDGRACSNLGELHELGAGVSRDPVRAHQLYQKACAGGYEIACPKARQASR